MPELVTPAGQPVSSDRCPTCGAGREKRMNAAGGFGSQAPEIVCARCGHHFEGETSA